MSILLITSVQNIYRNRLNTCFGPLCVSPITGEKFGYNPVAFSPCMFKYIEIMLKFSFNFKNFVNNDPGGETVSPQRALTLCYRSVPARLFKHSEQNLRALTLNAQGKSWKETSGNPVK